LTLKTGTKLKGKVIAVSDEMVEVHSFKNIHYIAIDEIKHVAVAESSNNKGTASCSLHKKATPDRSVGGVDPPIPQAGERGRLGYGIT